MGIKGLNRAIKKYAPKSIKEKNLKDYKGKIIAIDSEILIYKYRSQAFKQTDHRPDDFHLYAFTNNVINYLDHGIIPVYVFDGRPPVAKDSCLEKRFLERERVKSQINQLEQQFIDHCETEMVDQDSFNSYLANEETLQLLDLLLKTQNRYTMVSKQHRQECKYLLKLLGIPIISADGEAEALCVKLAVQGYVDYIYTEDSDAITYAVSQGSLEKDSKNDIRILKKSSSFNKVYETSSRDVLKGFSFAGDEFLDYCILCGCDYCPTIPKIGSITSYKLIKEHKNIEKILENNKKYKVPDNFNYQEARKIFKNPSVSIPEDRVKKLEIGRIDLSNLRKFLSEEKDMNPSPLIYKYLKAYQDAIGRSEIKKENKVLPKDYAYPCADITADSFRKLD